MEIRAEKISRQYHRQGRGTNVFTAVRETDLILPAGKLIEVEGRSGSGKSTLLNMMAGLLQPTAGRVLLDGQDLYSMPDAALSRLRSRALGVIPQGQTGLSSLTVVENVLLPTMLYGMKGAGDPVKGPDIPLSAAGQGGDRADAGTDGHGSSAPEKIRDRALALLEAVGIAHLQNEWPDQLSGGEMRRLAIARALMSRQRTWMMRTQSWSCPCCAGAPTKAELYFW